MIKQPVLFSYYRSSSAWRVRIALNLKRLQYEYRAVDLAGGVQQRGEFTALNPMQQVPTLLLDGATLTQSISIIEYLEDKYPSPALLPENPLQKAKVREICGLIVSGIQPMQNRQVIKKVENLAGAEKKAEWLKSNTVKGFTALESILSKCAGKYCVGNTITMADVCLAPQVGNAQRYDVDMNMFPLISKINKELEMVDAFQKARPCEQPDCPEDLRA